MTAHTSLVQALAARSDALICDCCKRTVRHRIAIHDAPGPPAMLCAECTTAIDFDERKVMK